MESGMKEPLLTKTEREVRNKHKELTLNRTPTSKKNPKSSKTSAAHTAVKDSATGQSVKR